MYVRTLVCVQVLLDEFISFVQNEKDQAEQQARREKEEEDKAQRVSGVLDPLVENLAQFNGNGDLTAKIAEVFSVMDADGSGGLSFDEAESGIKLVKTPRPVQLMLDDFEVLTEEGKWLDEAGEFNEVQFQSMMRGELHRYCQRAVQNAMNETVSKEFRALLLGIKLLDNHQSKQGEQLTELSSLVAEHLSASSGTLELGGIEGESGLDGGSATQCQKVSGISLHRTKREVSFNDSEPSDTASKGPVGRANGERAANLEAQERALEHTESGLGSDEVRVYNKVESN